MTENFAEVFRKRMKTVGDSRYKRNINSKSREFIKYFRDSLDRDACYINGVEATAIFQDHSQSNNKNLSDDKYLILPNDVLCDVGSYINWRNSEWLVFTEEFKTIPTHQQLKIKHVNHKVKWVVDYNGHKVCNNNEGWGAYVQNQTLYTLGVSFTGDHIALANAKMMLYLQNNEETRKIKIGTRFFLGTNIYRVMFADPISRTGLINLLLDEDTKNDSIDNYELGIANYWKTDKKDDEKHDDESNKNEHSDSQLSIIGDTKIKLGRSYSYKVVETNGNGIQTSAKVQEWNIESLEGMPLQTLERDENTLQVRSIDDTRNVGTVVNIMATVDGKVTSLTVKIVAKFF